MEQGEVIHRNVLAEHDDKRDVETTQRVVMSEPADITNIQRGDTVVQLIDGERYYWGTIEEVGDDVSIVNGLHALVDNRLKPENEPHPVHLRGLQKELDREDFWIEGVRTNQHAEVAGVDY